MLRDDWLAGVCDKQSVANNNVKKQNPKGGKPARNLKVGRTEVDVILKPHVAGPSRAERRRRNQQSFCDKERVERVVAQPRRSTITTANEVPRMDIDWERVCAQKGITAAGCTFLKQVLDPKHDTSFDSVGYVDRVSAPSVIRKYTQKGTVSFPAGNANFTGDTSFEVHVQFNPWPHAIPFAERGRANNYINQVIPSNTIPNWGCVQAWAVQTGQPWTFGSNDPAAGLSPLMLSLNMDTTVTKGVGRVVGMAIEVVNTTSPLYRSGSVTCWRAPEPLEMPTTFNSYPGYVSPNVIYTFTGQMMRYPPRTSAQALLYPSTVWEAEKGIYMPGQYSTLDNPPQSVDYTLPYLSFQNVEDVIYDGTAASLNDTSLWIPLFPTYNTAQAPGNISVAPGIKIIPMNQMGAIFAGLNPQSTLDVVMTYYYESFPSLSQVDILTIAKPSAMYDPVALEYMARFNRLVQVAVPSGENYDGEWFAEILEWLAGAAPIVGGLFGVPEVGLAASTLASYGARRLRK